MKNTKFIPVVELCSHYRIEVSFFDELHETGLIELVQIEGANCLHEDRVSELEKMIRMHHELEVNVAGIDVVFNLLQKVNEMQNELETVKSRLKLYENDQ